MLALGLLAQVVLGGGSGGGGANEPSIGITSIANTSCGINVGGTCALDPSFDLENDGDPSTTLAWVYSVDTIDDCGGTTGTGWLVATAPLTGTLDDTDSAVAKAAVFTDEDGCAAGNWDATLRVADNGSTPVANDTPQDIAITLTVTAPGTVWTPDFTLYAADGTTATPGGTLNCKRPCAVWADATSTTWSHPEDPLGPHAMDGYRWHFADPTDPSANVKGEFFEKDRGKGAFSGYVYDVVGSHTVTLNLDDGRGETGTAAATVVVSDFAGSEIWCHSTQGSYSFDSGECPTPSQNILSSNCNTLRGQCNSASSNCIVKAARGETYSGCATFGTGINTTGIFAGVGTHGSGARPIIQYPSTFNVSAWQVKTVGAGWFMDSLELEGPGTGGNTGAIAFSHDAVNGARSGLLLHDVVLTASTWGGAFASGATNPFSNIAAWDSTFHDLGLHASISANVSWFSWDAARVLHGFNTITDIYSGGLRGEHVIRQQNLVKYAARGNTVGGASNGKSDWAFRADRDGLTEHVYLHDNLVQSRRTGIVGIGEDSGGFGMNVHGRYYYIVDNWCEAYPTGLAASSADQFSCITFSPGRDNPVPPNSSIAEFFISRNVADMRLASGWTNQGSSSSTLKTVRFFDRGACGDAVNWPCENFAVFGNMVLGDSSTPAAYKSAAGTVASATIHCANGVAYDTAANAGSEGCDSGMTVLGGSLDPSTDPFNDVAGEPTDWPSVKITTGSALLGAGVDVSDTGVVNPAYSVYEDRFGNAFPNGAADAGVHEDP